ncbi:MAG: LysR substrate-binding domain-containing protein [Burkholderiaceae bacterium]
MSAVQAFVEIVEAGGVHAAARATGLSQSALSRSLRALEEDLSARLLTRSIQGVELTEEGRAFHQHAVAALRELSRAREAVQGVQGEAEGRLSVSLAPASTLELAPLAIADFLNERPLARLSLTEAIFPAVADMLKAGQVELAVVPMAEALSRQAFVIEPLFPVELAIIARRGHPLGGARSLRDLVGCDWLRHGSPTSVSPITRRFFADQRLRLPPARVASRSLMTTLMMLRNTDLVGVLPRRVIEHDVAAGTLSIIDIAEQIPTNVLSLAYRRDRPLTALAQSFCDHLRRVAGFLESGHDPSVHGAAPTDR